MDDHLSCVTYRVYCFTTIPTGTEFGRFGVLPIVVGFGIPPDFYWAVFC